MSTVATVVHNDLWQIISALTKYRRFEISICHSGDGFCAEIVYPHSNGENILKELQDTDSIAVLAKSIGHIEKVLESDKVFSDETYIGHVYLEGKTQYVSFDDLSGLVNSGQINGLIGKI